MESVSTVNEHLAEIGRKGGQRKCPHQKYGSNAERQRAYRARKGDMQPLIESPRVEKVYTEWEPTESVDMNFDFGS